MHPTKQMMIEVLCSIRCNANALTEFRNVHRKILSFANGVFLYIVTETFLHRNQSIKLQSDSMKPACNQQFLICRFSQNKPNRNFSPSISFRAHVHVFRFKVEIGYFN